MIDYENAFKKINEWAKSHITCRVLIRFKGDYKYDNYALEATEHGVLMLLGWGHDGDLGYGFTVDSNLGVRGTAKYGGNFNLTGNAPNMEAVRGYRRSAIECLVRYWHDEVKPKLIAQHQKEIALECFEA